MIKLRFKGKFFALAISINSQPMVYAKRAAGSEFTDPRLGSLTMLGSIPGSSIRGWLQAGMNKLLIQHGIMGVHPLTKIAVSNKNKKLFEKDLKQGYIARDEEEVEKHPIFQMFGSLGIPGNLSVSPVYFYPTVGANAFNEFNELFDNRIGTGFVETGFSSPTVQHDSSQRFLKTEYLRFRMIKAPIQFSFWKENSIHETLLVMAIEYLNLKNQEYNFDFLLGGNRRNGAGEVRIRLSDNMRCKTNTTGLDKETFSQYQESFSELIIQLKKEFQLKKNPEQE